MDSPVLNCQRPACRDGQCRVWDHIFPASSPQSAWVVFVGVLYPVLPRLALHLSCSSPLPGIIRHNRVTLIVIVLASKIIFLTYENISDTSASRLRISIRGKRGRVVYASRFENGHTRKSVAGSNPAVSAIR